MLGHVSSFIDCTLVFIMCVNVVDDVNTLKLCLGRKAKSFLFKIFYCHGNVHEISFGKNLYPLSLSFPFLRTFFNGHFLRFCSHNLREGWIFHTRSSKSVEKHNLSLRGGTIPLPLATTGIHWHPLAARLIASVISFNTFGKSQLQVYMQF